MDKILQTALSAEQQALTIMASAEQIKEDCERSITNADKIMGEYLNKAKAEVDEFYNQRLAETEQTESRIYDGLAAALDSMDKKYAAEGEKWVDKMFTDITTL